MKTLIPDFFISDVPIEMGVFDMDMNFIQCSKLWLKKLNLDEKSVVGKSYYDVFPETPVEIKEIHNHCLQGSLSNFEGEKTILPNGKIQQLKWKINPWKSEEGEINGLIIVVEDVTTRKNEEDYRLEAQKTAKIGGWEVNLLTNEIYWTSITKEIHGLDHTYVPSLEKGLNFYKEGFHRERIIAAVSEGMSTGTSWDLESVIVTAKGKEKWVRSVGKVELIDGSAVRLFGTFQDIEESKKAEVDHLETLDRLHIATKTANIGIWDFNIKSKFLSCDDSMYLLFELERADFIDDFEAWKSVIHKEDKARVLQEMYECITYEKEINTEYRIQCANGNIKHIKSIGDIHRDGNGVAIKVIGAKWDVTEFRHTELKLIKKKESFSDVFNNSSVGMALIDLDGRWLKINNSLTESLGYSSKELMKLTFKDITHPEDLVKDIQLLEDLKNSKTDCYQIEKRYFHKEGHLVYVIISVTKVANIDGSVSHFISQIVDITPRKETENKLKSVLKVTEDQNHSLRNFAHIVSHNLRSNSTNLSMLTGFLATEKDEEEKKNLLRMLNDSTESLDETIVHLNEVVNVKLNVVNKLEKVNVLYVLDTVKKSVNSLVKDRKVTFKINVPKSHNVYAVPAYLDSILLNLLTNSIKYSSPKRLPVIEISTKKVNGKIVLTFSDNGLGIDLNKHKDKLFGMYKTFHKHKDAKGIGLFITKNQMEAMNGKIEVDSTVDVGTTFRLYFKIK